MSEMPITPPVAPEILKAAEQDVKSLENVGNDLSLVQKFVKADKRSVIAALVHIAVLLVAALGMKLSGRDVAELGAIVTAGLSYFVGMNVKKL